MHVEITCSYPECLHVVCTVLHVHNVPCIFILYSQGSEEAVRSMYSVVIKNSGLITKDPAHFLKALAAIDHKAQACGVALILYVIRD